MSALINQARSRVPRIAEAAVERARLTVVPRRSSRAARVPFVTLVSLLLVSGVAGLLLFNTSMQQASFTATAMEEQASLLDAREQSLQMELEKLRDPQRVAVQARAIGMVPPSSPAFLRLSDGKVLGTPAPALVEDGLRVVPLPTRKPKNLRPDPVIVEAPTKSHDDGAADANAGDQAGTKKANQDGQQGSRR
jgi:cell division protein FtsB